MPSWPRDIEPQESSPFTSPGAFMSAGHTGKFQFRSTLQIGRVWTETYKPFLATSQAGRKLLTTIMSYWRNGTQFDIDHYMYLTKNGGGTGSPLVQGGSQTGSTLNTDGWTGSNPVLRAGDIIKVVGLNHVLEITADAPNLSAGAAALSIYPPIFAGGSPADNAAITHTAVRLNAYLIAEPKVPSFGPNTYIGGLTLTFGEAV